MKPRSTRIERRGRRRRRRRRRRGRGRSEGRSDPPPATAVSGPDVARQTAALRPPPVVATPGTRVDASCVGRPGRVRGRRAQLCRPSREQPVAVSVESHADAMGGAGRIRALWRLRAPVVERRRPLACAARTRVSTRTASVPDRVQVPPPSVEPPETYESNGAETARDETASDSAGPSSVDGDRTKRPSTDGTREDGKDGRSSSTCVLECSVGMSGVSARRGRCREAAPSRIVPRGTGRASRWSG